MLSNVIDKTIHQITQVQIWMNQYMAKERRRRSPDYLPPPGFFAVRDHCEGLRIKKLLLLQEKNRRLSSSYNSEN